MATTVHIPLALLNVSMANGNAYWSGGDGTNFDWGQVSFKDAVTGDSFWWGIIPPNVAATPAWNLILHHKGSSGSGGNVVLDVKAKDVGNNVAYDGALTALHTDTAFVVNTSANNTITTLSGTNYDATEAVAAGNFLIVQVSRKGAHASDTLNGVIWNALAVILRIDVQ